MEQLGLKRHDLNVDVLKVFLTNEAPVATDTVKLDMVEISAGNGYTAGGNDATGVWDESPAGTGRLVCTDIVWTASGGSIGPFRYAVLYNDSTVTPTDQLIGWWDYGSAITLLDQETFTLDFGATTLTIT